MNNGDADGALGFTSNLREPLLLSPDPGEHDDLNRVTDEAQQSTTPNYTVPTDKDITLCCGSKRFHLNFNVFLTLLVDIFYGISDSLWGESVFSAYLKQIGGGQNGPVGDVEAINGLAVLVSALPVGYLADRYGRSRVIMAGGILFVITGALHACLIYWIGSDTLTPSKSQLSMTFMAVLMGLWGVGGGIVNGPCQALYADSTPAGDRSKYYQYMFVCYLLATCIGPILSIILFQTTGDEWDVSSLQIIMYVGLGLEMLSATLMMFFDDSKALDEDDDTVDSNEVDAADAVGPSPRDESETQVLLDVESSADEEPCTENQTNAISDRVQTHRRLIPYILLLSETIVSIGSGMTIKFFPLFFKDEIGMSPTQVQLIYLFVPLVMAVFSHYSTLIASTFGRVQTCLVCQISGVACLISMVVFQSYLDKHKAVLVPVYIIRSSLMNAPYPLHESILMDYVPKHERARWKSLESISGLGWCGSAALGGYLSDKYDYTVTFFITACIQLLGTLMLALLLPLVPRREQDLSSSRRRRRGRESTNFEDEPEE